ncbi:MAG TPA: hypothetical protein VHZ55_12840 [Bryobacteraceae bacterium]|nr:hypothetical protein [Bryobacteraceae bacterium]
MLLRELRERGYAGGYTILTDWLRPPKKQAGSLAVPRFETPLGNRFALKITPFCAAEDREEDILRRKNYSHVGPFHGPDDQVLCNSAETSTTPGGTLQFQLY